MSGDPPAPLRKFQEGQSADKRKWIFRTAAAFVLLLALIVRAVYVDTAIVDFPIRGDSNMYVLRAWNLVHRGEFSTQMPASDVVVPEDHRGPGYPLFIALAMVAAGHSDLPLRDGPQGTVALGYQTDTWMQYVYAAQVVLGVLTVLLTMAIARFWLSRPASIVAGVLVAFWPHLVVSTGVLLTETVFSFTVALAVYAALRVISLPRSRSAIVAGLCFGVAYFVNPIIVIFGVFVAALIWSAGTVRIAAVFLIAFGILPAAWNIFSTHPISDLKSPAINPFVVGSWPEFYTAYNSRFSDETSTQIMAAYAEELKAFERSPAEGFRMIGERMSLDPAYYVRWYLLEKPFLLWDWIIRIGPGDFYTMETRNSPFERNPILRACASIYEVMNPIFFFSALFGAIAVTFRWFRQRGSTERLYAFVVAALFFYVTIVYSILSSEPRYSIPFRPFEAVLTVTASAWLWQIVRTLRHRDAQTTERAP